MIHIGDRDSITMVREKRCIREMEDGRGGRVLTQSGDEHEAKAGTTGGFACQI